MKTKHTPTPWKFNGDSIDDERGNTVAFPRSGGFMPGDRNKNMRANAELIVRAVNHHDKLIKHFELACDVIDRHGDKCAADAYRAVIKSAKGES